MGNENVHGSMRVPGDHRPSTFPALKLDQSTDIGLQPFFLRTRSGLRILASPGRSCCILRLQTPETTRFSSEFKVTSGRSNELLRVSFLWVAVLVLLVSQINSCS